MKQKIGRVIFAALVGAVVWAAFGAIVIGDLYWLGAIAGAFSGASFGVSIMLAPRATSDDKKTFATMAAGITLSVIWVTLWIIVFSAAAWLAAKSRTLLSTVEALVIGVGVMALVAWANLAVIRRLGTPIAEVVVQTSFGAFFGGFFGIFSVTAQRTELTGAVIAKAILCVIFGAILATLLRAIIRIILLRSTQEQ
jgi:hypothetical protein